MSPKLLTKTLAFAGMAIIIANSPTVRAQEKGPVFEVASIKPNKSGDLRTSAVVSPDRGEYRAENQSVKQLIRQAYGLKNFQLEGGPKWIDDFGEKYDVVAKAASPVSRDQLMRMLQALLEDRFKLTFHRETRQLPIYRLVVAKKGVLGPNLQPPAPSDFPRAPVSGPLTDLKGQNATMQDLASYLSGEDNRMVLDQTGLTGHYDFTLESAPGPDDPRRQLKALKLPPLPENRPTLFEALQQQLGLKLESARGPVQIMMIDRVARPSQN